MQTLRTVRHLQCELEVVIFHAKTVRDCGLTPRAFPQGAGSEFQSLTIAVTVSARGVSIFPPALVAGSGLG